MAAAEEKHKVSKAADYVVPAAANPKATVPAGSSAAAPPVDLGTDQLSYCADQYPPLSQCLAQYTDFYYDDAHKMPGAGAWNPVDAVTAQYVCKAGAIRRNSLAFTRTNVRWAVPPGAAEVLPCCDTLKCP